MLISYVIYVFSRPGFSVKYILKASFNDDKLIWIQFACLYSYKLLNFTYKSSIFSSVWTANISIRFTTMQKLFQHILAYQINIWHCHVHSNRVLAILLLISIQILSIFMFYLGLAVLYHVNCSKPEWNILDSYIRTRIKTNQIYNL